MRGGPFNPVLILWKGGDMRTLLLLLRYCCWRDKFAVLTSMFLTMAVWEEMGCGARAGEGIRHCQRCEDNFTQMLKRKGIKVDP